MRLHLLPELARRGWREGETLSLDLHVAPARGQPEAARALVPLHGLPGADYVLIARQSCADREWARLLDDVKTALIRLAADRRAEPQRP